MTNIWEFSTLDVSIHSRPIKPGEVEMMADAVVGENVSIHSRPIKPGESAIEINPYRPNCFNPLPTNKAGRKKHGKSPSPKAWFQSTPDQ